MAGDREVCCAVETRRDGEQDSEEARTRKRVGDRDASARRVFGQSHSKLRYAKVFWSQEL